MKKIFQYITRALAILVLASGCEGTLSDKEGGSTEGETPSEYWWHFSVNNAEGSPSLGVFLRDFDGSLTNSEIRIDAASGASFEIKTGHPLTTGAKIYAYSPYHAETKDHKAVRMHIPEEQTAGETAMPRAAVPLTLNNPRPDSTFAIQLVDLASVLSLKVLSTQDTDESITSVSFTSGTPLAGSFSFNIKGVDINQAATLAVSGYASKTVTVFADARVGTDPDSARELPMIVAPGSYTGTITIVTDKDRYSISVDDPVVLARAATVPLAVRIAPRVSRDEGGSTEDFSGGELITE